MKTTPSRVRGPARLVQASRVPLPSQSLDAARLLALCRELTSSRAASAEDQDALLMVVFAAGEPRFLAHRTREGSAAATELVRDAAAGFVLRPFAAAADPELPGARLLAEPQRLADLLGAAVESVAVLRHRPLSRIVLRVRTTAGVNYVKLLTKKGHRRALATFEALRPLAQALGLALPSRTLERAAASIAEPLAGRALSEGIATGVCGDADALTGWLRALWAAPAPMALGERTLEDERAATLTMLARGSWLLPELHDLAARIRALALPVWPATGLVHGDLHDKQVFAAPGAFAVLDCEGMRRGPAALDAVNLLEHLALRARLFPAHAAAIQTFAARVEARLASVLDLPGLAASRTLVRARLAGVYALRPSLHALARELSRAAWVGESP